MVDLTVLVKSVLEDHKETEEGCLACHRNMYDEIETWPCPPYRIAADWLRQHRDLCRAWKNRTGKEVFLVRKFACAICSEKDTGLICAECIADVQKGEDLEHKDVIEEMANG